MPAEIRLSREMRLLDVTMIGVGAMIGAGIFVLIGIAAGVSGPSLTLVFVALILGVGVLVSNAVAGRVTQALREEGVARAALVGKGVKGALVAVVLALALWQLQIAREIVLAGFLIGFGSIGVAFALGAGLGMSRAIEHGLQGLLRGDRKPPEE